MLSRQEIKAKAQEILADINFAGIYPTRVEAIIEECFGYACLGFNPSNSKDTMNISGAVFHDKKIVYYNITENLRRQIFTIAHELGHIVLHKDKGNLIDYRQSVNLGTDYWNSSASDMEKEANHFAAEILMPEEDFRKVHKNNKGSLDRIADYFGASTIATSIRAKLLGLPINDKF